MSAAPSACASALSLEMMSANAPNTAVRRICQTRGCHVSFRENGHRHCCAECKRTFGARHSGRCRDVQRRDRASVHEAPAAVGKRFFPCCTSGCARVTTGTYLYCCSYCADSGGTLHSVRCQNRRGVTYPAGTTGVTGTMLPSATSVTSMAGAGAGTMLVPTAWNTAWPAPMSMTDAGDTADHANAGDDGDGRAAQAAASDRVSARASRWSSRHPLQYPASAVTSEQCGASEMSEASSSVQPVKPVQDLTSVIDLEEMD